MLKLFERQWCDEEILHKFNNGVTRTFLEHMHFLILQDAHTPAIHLLPILGVIPQLPTLLAYFQFLVFRTNGLS